MEPGSNKGKKNQTDDLPRHVGVLYIIYTHAHICIYNINMHMYMLYMYI